MFRRFPQRLLSTEQAPLQKTVLYNTHVEHGGKMVPFAGWLMPVQYSGLTISQSSIHTRTKASLFDVSHMLQTRLEGRDRARFLEKLVVADLKELKQGQSVLSVFMNERGGVVDDTVLNQQTDYIYIVSNAGCADKDWDYLTRAVKRSQKDGLHIALDKIEDQSLLALQGPKAVSVLKALGVNTDFQSFAFMSARKLAIKGIPCHVSRSGYTGEDGFEIQVPSSKAVELASILIEQSDVEWAGLGARDVLRLEAGMCLYGHDLDEDTSPVEAGLSWTIAKRRRTEGGFLGAATVLKHLKDGPPKRRVGLILDDGSAPAREGYVLKSSDGSEAIGQVTSGSPSPNLKKNIGMGYVKNGFHKSGTRVQVVIRNKPQSATISKMPVLPSRYHKA
jgi:aminomethyltransferase